MSNVLINSLNFDDGSMISIPNVAGLLSDELFKYHFTLQNNFRVSPEKIYASKRTGILFESLLFIFYFSFVSITPVAARMTNKMRSHTLRIKQLAS